MINIFATLGPSTLNKYFLQNLNPRYIKLLRINLSHTDLKEITKIVNYIRRYTKINICLDTEGAQIRTSKLSKKILNFKKNDIVYFKGHSNLINLVPKQIENKFKINDIISIDFNSVKVRIISQNDRICKGKVITGGMISSNKGVSIDRIINLPSFTEKDIHAFDIANKLKINHIALSFTSKSEDVVNLRKYFNYKIAVTSKIESRKGLKNLKSILSEADNILIDRGDLSREIKLEKIPKTQKNIIMQANKHKTPVYVATNLLESMVTKQEPTRAEINDVYNTLIDGATGLVLAAETAIGKYPNQCIEMLRKVAIEANKFKNAQKSR